MEGQSAWQQLYRSYKRFLVYVEQLIAVAIEYSIFVHCSGARSKMSTEYEYVVRDGLVVKRA